jgi:GNAT superfamily N-acetyltransferase
MSPSEIRELEHRALKAWPALETRANFGWVQRFAGGYTKRANSINAIEDGAHFTPDVMTELERPYRERGHPPIWRLTPLAPPEADAALAGRGYRRIDQSLVQQAPLDERFTADPAVRIDATPPRHWLAGFAGLSPVALRHRETMELMLHSIAAPVGFASVDEDGQPAGFALGVVEGDHVGLFDVLVAPTARRRGMARRLTQSIGAWGRTHGARVVYLQVVATNLAALPLYAALGFTTVYSYAYRVP